MQKLRLFFAAFAVVGFVFFACSNDNNKEQEIISTDDSSSSNGAGVSSSNNANLSSGEFLDESSSSESQDESSSSSLPAPDLGANCSYEPAICDGIPFNDIVTASIVRQYVKEDAAGNEIPSCIFATAIEQMGNESAGLKVNGMKIGNNEGRCGNSGWGQPSCEEALKNVQKIDGGYYIWVGKWAGDFNTTGGTPICDGSGSGSSSPSGSSSSGSGSVEPSSPSTGGNGDCAYLPIWCGGAAQGSIATTAPAVGSNGEKCFFATSVDTYCSWGNNSKINGVDVGQGNIGCWSSNGTLPEKVDGGYYIWIGGGLSDFNGTAGSPVCSGGGSSGGGTVTSTLTCTGLATTGTASTAITRPTVRCNNTAVAASNITWAPTNLNWSSASAGTYDVTAKANSGTCNGQTADCGRIVVAAAASSLTCTGLAQTGVSGAAVTRPTVRCNNTAVATNNITWAPTTLNWSSASAGTYDVRATATCGTSQTVECGRIVVSTPTFTCGSVQQTVTLPNQPTAPTVGCGGNTVTSGVTFTNGTNTTINFSNATAGTYTSIKATASCGGSNQTANCSGTLTVNAKPTLSCAAVPTTGTAGTIIASPIVKCGDNNVSANQVTWSASSTLNWTNPVAGTYTNIRATASCGGENASANCAGTLVVSPRSSSSVAVSSSSRSSSSVSSGGSDPSYPALVAGQSGVMTGYATRYWDACKANCTWGGKTQALGSRCKACDDKGLTEIAAENATSSCDGGNAYTCFDQTPYKVNDNLSYAFAATPGNGSDCGKCYQLQFDGTGKYSTNGAHTSIKGKTIIVISSNIGHDVSGGQFDVMIPGGGVGAFNALTKQLNGLGMSSVSNSTLGEQYGGLLTACQKDLGYNASVSQYQSCVKQKCTQNFGGSNANLAPMKAGCDWFADWMMAADNPNVLYKQVTCPDYLINKYKATK